ncbi:MAG: hypothetical protein RLZZ303_592 [Candidatus Hydrogenedentota bacterium]
MCGIAGLLDFPTPTDTSSVLESMHRALAHRGPDASGMVTFPGGGLTHTRLSVIDCSDAANQPFSWADARYHLVYNGELYNFRELRRELEQRGASFRTTGDTEVVAAALAEWGTDAFRRFNGMFALAWHDAQDNSLLLARDRLGIKPLHYAVESRGLAFASELGALRLALRDGGSIDREALDAYFALQYIPAPRTIYQCVRKLRPGHWLRFHAGGLKEDAYWRLEYKPDPAWTLGDAAGRYRELLDDAVRMQRIADVPLGAFLSGGLDSSSVVATLARQSEAPVETFSIGFEDASADERPYARAVAQAFHTNHHESLAQPGLAEMLPKLVQRMGEPFADSSILPTWLVSRLARERVTVALSGDGGDELFAGYTWLRHTLLSREAARIPAPLRNAMRTLLGAAPGSARAGQARRFLADAGLPLREAFRRRLTLFDAPARQRLLGRALDWDPFGEAWDAARTVDERDRMLAVDTALYLPDDVLAKVDRMSMAHALEVRVPLLDHRIVEFAASLPFALKLSGGESKRVAKEAFRNVLPPPVLRQRKRGFAIPIDAWFRGGLGQRYRERILESEAPLKHLADIELARALFQEHQSGQASHGHRLWSLLVLNEFLATTKRD